VESKIQIYYYQKRKQQKRFYLQLTEKRKEENEAKAEGEKRSYSDIQFRYFNGNFF
jgi:hypothetical protein